MGLGDIFNNVPDSFAGQAERRLGSAFAGLPEAEAAYRRNQQMKQANIDQQYNSPARPATPHETDIGGVARKMMGLDDPNVPPEWKDKLMQELSGRTSQQGLSPNRMMASGVQGAANAIPPQYGPSREDWQPTGRGDLTRDADILMAGGLSEPKGLGMDLSPQRVERKPLSMTQGDVDKYMKFAPMAQKSNQPSRDYLGEIALRATMKGEQDRQTKGGTTRQLQTQAEGAKRKNLLEVEERKWFEAMNRYDLGLQSIEARIKVGTDTAIKVAQIRSAAQRYAAEINGIARELSSLPNVAENQRLIEHVKKLRERSERVVKEASQIKTSDDTQSKREAAIKWINDPANANDPRLAANKKKYGVK